MSDHSAHNDSRGGFQPPLLGLKTKPRRIRRDNEALPWLIEAMSGASDRDFTVTITALSNALALCQRSSARPTIEDAVARCVKVQVTGEEPDFDLLWSRAFTATRQLTFADPPDISLLPIPPAMRGIDCANCQRPTNSEHRFCPFCGAEVNR